MLGEGFFSVVVGEFDTHVVVVVSLSLDGLFNHVFLDLVLSSLLLLFVDVVLGLKLLALFLLDLNNDCGSLLEESLFLVFFESL